MEAALGNPVKPSEVGEGQAGRNAQRAGHGCEGERCEVTLDAVRVVVRFVRRAEVGHEAGKGSVLDAAAASSVGDVPGSVHSLAGSWVVEVSWDPGAVATEAVLGVEDGRVEEHISHIVKPGRVLDPVPVRDAIFPAASAERLFK